MSRIEQSGRSLLRRPKLPIKGGSALEEEEEDGLLWPKLVANNGNDTMKKIVVLE